jgi:hypothetical protein
MFGTDPLDHGFGFLRAGSDTIVNNSGEDLYGSDIVGWQFGSIDGGRDYSNQQPRRIIDTGLNPWAGQNKEGTPLGKALIQIKRFDPMDFSFQVAGAVTRVQGGVQGVTLKDFLAPEPEKELSTLQEEGFALQHGIAQIALQHEVRRREKNGDAPMTKNEIDEFYKSILEDKVFYARILDRNIPANDAAVDFNRSNRGVGENYAKYTIDILYGGIFNAAYAKMSRIIGKVMRSSKNGASVDIMFSHFKCWI